MSASLSDQAERLYEVFCELVRAYQFRDRQERCCHGLSVSQCYTLEALHAHGSMTMSELAARMHLEVSTMTRVIDYVVEQGLATRGTDTHDRRVCRIRISRKGRALVARIRAELVAEHQAVLAEIPAGSREDVIRAIALLLDAFRQRGAQLACDAATSHGAACGKTQAD
jgi:DNA-binding MarR family transcriptional regulator